VNDRVPYEQAANLLRRGERFLVTGHVRADGDCLGAESALYHLLRALGKEVAVVNPDAVAPRYSFLAEHTPYAEWKAGSPRGGVPPFDVACVLDVALLARAGAVGDLVAASGVPRIAFDHHEPSDANSWDVALIDPTAPATGVLIHRLARRMGIALPLPALEAVFVSIVTDTGWFKYSNTDRETFQIAADLVEAGVRPVDVYAKVFQDFPPRWPIGVGVALRSLRYEADGRLAIAAVRRQDLETAGGDLSDTDEVLDILRAVGRVEVVLLFRESAPGRVKLSARSKGGVDVNALLRPLGGGGHKRAAGADLTGSVEDVVARVVRSAVEALSGDPRSAPSPLAP
jgi:phosphoesterase RecJ-like protein